MKKIKIAIVDYGMGNIGSLYNALISTQKCEVILSKDPEELKNADGLFLPGVGAYRLAMQSLKENNLDKILTELAVHQKKPLMAICLGMQLLFEYSEEGGKIDGLGWIPGSVRKFVIDSKLRVPHVGWNNLEILNMESVLMNGISNGTDVYFLHSYHVCTEQKFVVAKSDYDISFTASIEAGNIFATQFHPEKSQKDGIKILENYIDYVIQNSNNI